MRNDSTSDVAVAAAEAVDDERSITAVADQPPVMRERAPEIQPGDLLAGRYQIEAVIGKGGSGVVLRAFDRVSASVVAVKVLKPGLSHDPRWEKRFQRELRLGRPVRHPNVCRIFDIGDADGYRFLTMEYATGGTLRDLIKKNAPLRPLQERLTDAAGVIAGLAAIHGAGIVHRDVKPDNMLRMEDGRLVLSDFGLATDLPDSTMVSVFVGTPHYMAPEVREGDPATTRSDVWSLGVVLHELLVGRRPDRRNSRSGASSTRPRLTKTSSTVERAMLALSEHCLADDPADRPADASAVERMFERARRSPLAILKSSRRRLARSAGLAVLGAAIAVGVGVGVKLNRRPAPASPARAASAPRLVPTGEAADWSGVARVIAAVQGRAHCFSMIDPRTARLIWGTPRRAEDIDVDSGSSRPSPLRPETYASGCPQLAPDGGGLLFTGLNATGTTEIRLSKAADGREAIPLTPGADPEWLRNGEEFVYTIDAAHAAAFSLATMSFRLLSDPGAPGNQMILLKAVSRRSDAVALLFYSKETQWNLALFEGQRLDHKKTMVLPAGYEIRFDQRNDNVLVSHQLSGAKSTLASLDWRLGTFKNIGRYPGLDLVDAWFQSDRGMLVGRSRKTDVWLYDGKGKRRLTTDGESYSAALSGDVLLVNRRTADGTISIWSRDRSGGLEQVTPGPQDAGPEFSADGRRWAYADYHRKSIYLCETGAACKVFVTDEMLPTWPRFSPDGQRLAFMTQVIPARLHVATLADGRITELGTAAWQCPPVWTSATRLWSFEGAGTEHYWAERDVITGARTGQRKKLAGLPASQDQVQCWPAGEPPNSPFFQRLRAESEETTKLFQIPLARAQ